MINKIMLWAAKFTVGKYVVTALAWVHDKLDGHRSELIIAGMAVTHILKLTGLIPADAASAVEAALMPLLPVTLADKASKAMQTIDSVAPPPPTSSEAPKAP